MKTSTIVWVVVILAVLGGGWYLLSSQSSSPAPAATSGAGTYGSPDQGNTGQPASGQVQQPQTAAPAPSAALGTASSASLGQYLVASNGMTLYMYKKDSAGKSTCTGTCAQNWPPYTVASLAGITIPIGMNGADVTGLSRADGSVQLMYKGMPLYFYAGDKAAGETNGQGVGGVWSVVKP